MDTDALITEVMNMSRARGLPDEGVAMIGAVAGALRKVFPLKSRDKSNVVRTRKRDASSTRLSEFDVDYQGQTVNEILGDMFANSVFRSDVEKQTIAKDLLQMVMFSDQADDATRRVALQGYSQINSGALFQQAVEMSSGAARMGLTSTLLDPDGKYNEKINPPTLGNEGNISASLSKNLMAAIGGKKLLATPRDGSKPVIHALPTIAGAITANNLNADAAFTLMLNITSGTLYDYIYNAQRNPQFKSMAYKFEHMWLHIQKISKVAVSTDFYEKELEKLISNKPSRDISEVLTRIQTTIQKMYENMPGAEERASMIKVQTVAYLFHWVEHHHYNSFPSIENVYEDERAKDEANQRNAIIQNVPYVSTFDPIDSLISIIISYLDKRKHMLQGVNIPKTSKNHAGKVESAGPKGDKKRGDDKKKSQKPAETKAGAAKVKKTKANPANATIETLRSIESNIGAMVAQFGQLGMPSGAHNAPPQQQRGQILDPNGIKKYCALCSRNNHYTRECITYPNEQPGSVKCQNCNGRHVSQCKKRVYTNNQQNPQQNNSNQNNYQKSNNTHPNSQNQGQQSNNQQKSNNNNSNNKFPAGQGIGNANRQHAPMEAGNN
jgi:hypothetical protein